MRAPCSIRGTPSGCSDPAPPRSARSTSRSTLPSSFQSLARLFSSSGLVQVSDEPGPASHEIFLLETAAAERLAPEAFRDLLLLPGEGIGPRLRRRADLSFPGDAGAGLVFGIARQQISLPGAGRWSAHLLAIDELHGIEGVATGALRIAAEVPERIRVEVILGGALGAREHQALFDDARTRLAGHLRSPPSLPSWRASISSTRGAGRRPSRCLCPRASAPTSGAEACRTF